MGLHYRHSLTLIPGVRLNIGRRGISTTIGVPGASVNLGARGAYVNLGIPGTGLGVRSRVDPEHGRAQRRDAAPEPNPRLTQPEWASSPEFEAVRWGHRGREVSYVPAADIGSAPVGALTSPGLAEFKRIVQETLIRKSEIEREIPTARWQVRWSKFKRGLAKVVLLGLANGLYRRQTDEIAAREDELMKLQLNLEESVVHVEFDMADEIRAAFDRFATAFKAIRACSAKWDVTRSRAVDQFHERSIASNAVARKPIEFWEGNGPGIKTYRDALAFGNITGTTLYLYPGFALVTNPRSEFALVEFTDLRVAASLTRFQETEGVPADGELVGQTWFKANKDGSRDRRFNGNYQIPIVQYGQIEFTSAGGINERYLLSRSGACMSFGQAFDALGQTIRRVSKQ